MTSRAVGIQTAYDYMNKNQAAATWDNSVGQNYVEFETSDGTVQIWLEDEQSLEAKVNVMKEHNLGGIAAWKLGFDEISGASSVDLRQSKPENRIRNTAGDATHRSVMH